MSDLVRFHIPASFVRGRVDLTPVELAWRREHGWLEDGDVVELALERQRQGRPLTQAEEELLLLLPRQYGRVPELAAALGGVSSPGDDPEGKWLYLALAWLHEHRHAFGDPPQLIEMLHADFGHSQEIDDLVRYMPVPAGAPTGRDAIEQRWRRYLERKRGE